MTTVRDVEARGRPALHWPLSAELDDAGARRVALPAAAHSDGPPAARFHRALT